MAVIRKLIGKLLKKLGIVYVKKVTPSKHHALIDYIERARRKRANKAKRLKLLALLGKEVEAPAASTSIKKEEEDSEDDIDSESSEEEEEEHQDKYSEDEGSSSDESEEEEVKAGTDHLMTDTIDIPRVDNIPTVSKLAKEKKIENQGRSKLIQLADSKEKVK